MKSTKIAIALFLTTFFSNAHSAVVSIIEPGVSDFPSTVGGYDVIEYKDATSGGGEWSVTGTTGGNATQLWLFSIGGTASTQLTEASTAVAFMMRNDSNDGIARFYIDNVNVYEYDTYMPSEDEIDRTFIFSDLAYGTHELSIEYLGGGTSPNSQGIALYGGAALSQVPVPAAVWLFGSGLVGLIGVARKRTA